MNLIKKFIIYCIVLIVLFFIILFISAWNMGAFSSIKLFIEERGPYYIVTFKQGSSYEIMGKKIDQIKDYLNENNIDYTISSGILNEDPFNTSVTQIYSRGGCIVRDSVIVDTQFVIKTIAKRWVLVASIKANPAIAPYKTYPALTNQIRKESLEKDNEQKIIELYYNDGLVEVELPILHD